MKPHGHDQMTCTAARRARIAAIHRAHAAELERRVARRAYATPQTIEDACSHAWMQLLTHADVDLSPPWRAVAWLAQTATREVWRLERRRRREELVDPAALDERLQACAAPGADELAAQRDRLRLVARVAERPRRFLLQLAAGRSYREIAFVEGVSPTTTAHQIARARQLLRALDAEHAAQSPASRPTDDVDAPPAGARRGRPGRLAPGPTASPPVTRTADRSSAR